MALGPVGVLVAVKRRHGYSLINQINFYLASSIILIMSA